jgi:regulation of enolase protein 1 (concanavalin A-like superfamily)
LNAIPAPLEWRGDPAEWGTENAEMLWIQAGERTDLFTDPRSGEKHDEAPAALFGPPDARFMLSARVEVRFASTYDAGVVLLRADEDRWAKLCFERSPRGEAMIVSVVNQGRSDDCNSVVVEGGSVHLRVSQDISATAFHYSLDGKRWSFVRHFSLGPSVLWRAGFSSQSPTGTGCRAAFSDVNYRAGFPEDLRSGD